MGPPWAPLWGPRGSPLGATLSTAGQPLKACYTKGLASYAEKKQIFMVEKTQILAMLRKRQICLVGKNHQINEI